MKILEFSVSKLSLKLAKEQAKSGYMYVPKEERSFLANKN